MSTHPIQVSPQQENIWKFLQRKFSPSAPSLVPLVLLLLLGQLLIWTLATGLTHHAPDLDNNEELVWGSALEWGYYKHPPLPSWLLYGLIAVFGKSVWLTFFAAQLCVVLALWYVWRLGCEMTTQARALVAMLLLSMVAYFTTRGIIYNHNTVQLWPVAAAILMFYRALRHDNRYAWAALGLFGGLSMLTKYSALVQFATFFLYMLVTGHLRETRTWRGIGIATGVFVVIMTPHLIWLTGQRSSEGGGPVGYAMHSLSAPMTRTEHFGIILDFFATSFGRLAPMAVALAVVLAWAARSRKNANAMSISTSSSPSPSPSIVSGVRRDDRWFILFMALCPFILMLTGIIGLKAPLISGWATTFFLPFGFLAFWWLRSDDDSQLLRQVMIVVISLQVVSAVGYGVARGPLSEMTGRATRATYPAAAIAAAMEREWYSRVAAPLRFVGAETWVGGNIATHASTNVKVVIDGDFTLAPWVSESEADACGMLVALDVSADNSDRSPPKVSQLLSRATWTGTTQLPWTTKPGGPLVVIKWGIIAPKSTCELP